MIHTIKLSPETCARLSEIVRLQMDLLWFAAEQRGHLTGDQLSVFLRNHTSRKAALIDCIVHWLFHSRTSKPLELLQDFVGNLDGQSPEFDADRIASEKLLMVEYMRRD